MFRILDGQFVSNAGTRADFDGVEQLAVRSYNLLGDLNAFHIDNNDLFIHSACCIYSILKLLLACRRVDQLIGLHNSLIGDILRGDQISLVVGVGDRPCHFKAIVFLFDPDRLRIAESVNDGRCLLLPAKCIHKGLPGCV